MLCSLINPISLQSVLPFKVFFIGTDNHHKYVPGQGETINFTGRETYNDFMETLCKHFNVDPNGKRARFGSNLKPIVTTFNGKLMHEFTSKNKHYTSKANVYLVVDDDDETEPEIDQPPRHKAADAAVPTTSSVIDAKELKYGRSIGQGGCSTVHEGKWNGFPVAIKDCLNVRDEDSTSAMIEEEAKLLSGLKHPNILQFFGLAQTEGKTSIVMELMDKNLFECVFAKKKETIGETLKLDVVVGVIQGVTFLHGKKIVHGDLKLENILLSRDMTSVKICDFGLSRVKTDVWAVGGVVTETFTEKVLWGTFGKKNPKTAMVDLMRKKSVPSKCGRSSVEVPLQFH